MSFFRVFRRFHAARRCASLSLAALFRFRPSRFYLLAAVVWQILAWLQAFYIYRHLTGKLLVLHYKVDFGVDRVGDPAHIFFLPLFGLIILVFNFLLAALFHRHKDFKVLTHVLLGGAVVFGFFLVLVLWSIYLINFF